jgi:hypothetical protein
MVQHSSTIKTTISFATLSLLIFACSKATNPYADRYRGDRVGSGPNEANTEESAEQNAADGKTETPDLVSPDALSEEELSLTELVCTNGDKLAMVKDEFEQLCQGEKPTEHLSTILTSPYTGQGEPSIISIRSEDVNGVSHISGVTSFKVSASLDELLKKRGRLDSISVQAGNAELNRQKLGDIAASGDFDIPGSSLRESMTVRVLFITVDDTSVSETKGITLLEDKAVAFVTKLKSGEADNVDNPRANMIAIWLAVGDETMVLVSFYQEIENQGRHATVAQTASGIGAAMNKETYNQLSSP